MRLIFMKSMFIKTKISSIRGSVDQHNNARELQKAIDDQFVSSDKALASTLIMRFTSQKLAGLNGVRENITQMRDIATQLKSLEVDMFGSFLVHYILNTLPPQYAPFKISYNTHKDKCSINELMTMCVQEEWRLAMEARESVHMAIQRKNKDQVKGKGRCVTNEDSSILWHWRLGHVSIGRIEKLVIDGVFNTLDFTDFDTRVDCIKGKQINVSKKSAKRSSKLLEIIHTDIYCPDLDSYGQRYFITFIDNYSCYMCIYFLEHKGEVLDAFEVFKEEVEKQCDKHIIIVRSNRGGEYFGRFTKGGQAPGPFVKFLVEQVFI
ncbi:UNVERIFIED_CONTAM: hypothetical protein Sangu_1015600 [Sesamum angustifolium]|uniref:GAG-pre-integrase domain-containing protein n=1 Tax=Sesamum angustifolium TaxID=2727405 RepID=A0AAW2PFA4_9LAMI